MGKFIWQPTKEIIENSNIKKFMDLHGIKTKEELIKKSQDNIEWFWDAVIKDMNIEFYKPYDKILDTSKGIQWPKWFINGKINIAHNCIDRHIKTDKINKIAILWEGEDFTQKTLSYWDIYVSVNKLSNALKKMGVSIGDTVGIFIPMLPETVIATMAIAKIGAIMVPIFSGYGPAAVASRLQDAESKVLITTDGFYRRGSVVNMKKVADEAVELSPSVKNVIVVRRMGQEISWKEGRDVYYDDITKDENYHSKTEELDTETPYYLGYTSGTTGKPKGIVHVQGGLSAKVPMEVYYHFDLKEEDRFFWFTDIGWMMAPWEFIGVLTRGGTLFLYEGSPDYPQPDRIWDVLERNKITIFGFSPTAVRALMRQGEDWIKKHDLSSLRILGSTGEAWNPEPYIWYFNNVGSGKCPIINISGGTDICGCFLSPLIIGPLKPCTLQGPTLGADIDVLDSEGKSIKGGVGELVCKKPLPTFPRGFWKDPQRYIETYWSTYPDIWHHGDFASIDEDGLWYLYGRSDDTIKIAGKRVGPAEVESAAVFHPGVSESAAIGIPDEIKGEDVMLFAILKPGYEPSDNIREEIKSTVVKHLGKTIKPKDVRFVKDLPKTRNAKIMRRVIRASFLGKDPGDISSLENPQAVEEIKKAR